MPRKRQRTGHMGQGPGDNKGTFWQEDLVDLDDALVILSCVASPEFLSLFSMSCSGSL